MAEIGNLLRSTWADARARMPRQVDATTVICGVLALGLVVQAGRLVWILVEPHPGVASPAVTATPPPDFSVFGRFDAFFRTGGQSSLAEATGADAAQMRLYGVRAGGPDGGSAIIGLADGRQVSFGVGEEVEPGLVLQSVQPDHVILARGGSVSRLVFTEIPPGAPQPPAPAPTPQVVTPTAAPAAPPAASSGATPAAVDPRRLIAQAGLRPRMKGMGLNGFTVIPTGDGAALRAAGLRAGDVILSVDGVELNSPQAVAGLRDRLAGAQNAQIRFERDGVVQTSSIRASQ